MHRACSRKFGLCDDSFCIDIKLYMLNASTTYRSKNQVVTCTTFTEIREALSAVADIMQLITRPDHISKPWGEEYQTLVILLPCVASCHTWCWWQLISGCLISSEHRQGDGAVKRHGNEPWQLLKGRVAGSRHRWVTGAEAGLHAASWTVLMEPLHWRNCLCGGQRF